MSKHKRHRVSGPEGLLGEILEGSLPGLGMIGAHEIKSMLPASFATSVGPNYPWVVNGLGILAGVGLPMLIKDNEVKKYVKPLGFGVAGQCLYSLFLTQVAKANPPVVNKTWNTYALGKPSTYALGCVQQPDGSMMYYQLPGGANGCQNPGGQTVQNRQTNAPVSTQVNPTATANAVNPSTRVVTRRINPAATQVQAVSLNGRRRAMGGA